MGCNWPEGTCACYAKQATEPDPFGRVWMHCESGLKLSKASMSRFVMFCLLNNIEIGDIYPVNRNFRNSEVLATVLIKPHLIAVFESETGGKLTPPPVLSLNQSSPRRREDTPND